MNAPLYNALIKYSQKNKPFHMPGHKFGRFGAMKSMDFTALDATEASGLDNLYEAEGIIKEAMSELSRFYGSKHTVMLTNGSTVGILASLLTVCKAGDSFLVARNCHHSVWNGLILGDINPIYVNPEYDKEQDILTYIQPEGVRQLLKDNPNVKGLIMVSPTYEGITSPIQQIAEILHEQDKILIIDEAHGAHFEIDEVFPTTALKLGADLVIHSMHKTLPTWTQSALLHIGSDRVNKESLMKTLRMVQTSSPSYLMMGTMDYMRAYLEYEKEFIRGNYITPLKQIRIKLGKLKHLKLIENNEYPYDISKIIISTKTANCDGYTLAKYLEEDYNMICEAATTQYIILMTTVADEKKGLEELAEALIKLDEKLGVNQLEANELEVVENPYGLFKAFENPQTMPPRKAHYSNTVLMTINKCEGKFSAETIMMYPPGIPIVCVGEKIATEHIQLIKRWYKKLQGIKIEGNEIICKVVVDNIE